MNEIETEIIGSVLAHPNLFDDPEIYQLTPDDFSSSAHQTAWKFIRSLASNGKPITTQSLSVSSFEIDIQELERWKKQATGNIDTLRAMCKEIVHQKRIERTKAILTSALKDVESMPKSLDKHITNVVHGLTSEKTRETALSATEIRRRLIDRISEQEKIPTGLNAFDNKFDGGLPIPSLVTVFAPPKAGKTTLIATISHNIQLRQIPHLVISIEWSAEHIETLKIAKTANINAKELKNLDHIPEIQNSGMCYCLHNTKLTIDQLRHEVLYQKRKNNIKVVLIDYLQLILGKEKGEYKNDFISRVLQELNRLSHDSNTAIFLLAQLGSGVTNDDILHAQQSANTTLIMNRDIAQADTWFEMRASNISSESDIGSINSPAIILDSSIGPHFKDATDFNISIDIPSDFKN
jgi:replicative DNA helicase